MGNFRETFGNFLETVRVVIGQESVRVGMWSHELDLVREFLAPVARLFRESNLGLS